MAIQKVFYECGFCKRLYDEEAQAIECERHHAELSELKVIDSFDTDGNSDDLFPGKILLKHDKNEEQIAEYKLKRKGRVIDFYQS